MPEVSKGKAPHKPLLLLALLDLIDSKEIASSFINSSSDLEKLNGVFTSYWNRIFPAGEAGDIALPFAHLHNEPSSFWILKPVNGQEINPRDISSIAQLQRVIDGAQLDEDLFLLMRNKQARSALRSALLEAYFSEDAQKALSEKIGLGEKRLSTGDQRMNKLIESLRRAFPLYLKQFLDRSRSDSQDLKQIPISAALLQISRQLGISFKTSFGMGQPTKIPWLACFMPGQSASVEGVYPVILYRKDARAVTVNYGVSATAQASAGDWPRKWTTDLVAGLSHFPDKKYNESFMYMSYEGEQVEDVEGITNTFIKVITDFLTLTPSLAPSLIGVSQKAYNDLVSSNLRLQESTLVRYISSLLTKRFVILTGLSGSGKTKLAHAFASWLCQRPDQYRLVAVGADWTSNENILGFQDALQTSIYRKPSSGALDLILRADQDPERPYFLILDEMNLSHVERYFADILSGVESGQEIALHSAKEPLFAFEGDPLPVPSRIRLPNNLFIIGTVNIDETTYMFSPKVLDRANVIEFRATKDEIFAFLERPLNVNMSALEGKGASFGIPFLQMAQQEVLLPELPSEIGNGREASVELKRLLTELFAGLAPIGAEFGFRTAFEITRFIFHHAMLTGPGWQFTDALDAQVIQKLMPKLHGSDRKLRPTLETLEKFCHKHQLKLSLEKTQRMLERLVQDGFTSFAEA